MDGGNIYTLSGLLGYSSVTVTEKAYLDINTDDLCAMQQKRSLLKNINFRRNNVNNLLTKHAFCAIIILLMMSV